MGGAQPLAATMAGASMLAIECRPERIAKRLETRYLDREARTLDEALALIDRAREANRPISVGLLGNACELLPELLRRKGAARRGDGPDVRARPRERLFARRVDARALGPRARRESRERRCRRAPLDGEARRSDARVPGARCAGLRLRQQHPPGRARRGRQERVCVPGFRPAVHPPFVLSRASGPFRWAALSGDPTDIERTDAKVRELLPDDAHLHRWLDMARDRIAFQGLPARICWVGTGRSSPPGSRLQRHGGERGAQGTDRDRSAITWIQAASLRRTARPEAMRDGSDAVSDWPLLNALLNTASGATWVSIHHGGGVGMGYSQHAGVVIVCDGTPAAARRIERVLWNDPATGVMRHADAGYEIAIDCARERGLDLPSLFER
jgi:urocanate hydratase